MKIYIVALALFGFLTSAAADERIEFGLGFGPTYPIAGSDFKDVAGKGSHQSYWLGYEFEDNLGVEAGVDVLTFDTLKSSHQNINLGLVYRFTDSLFHPLIKIGVGSVQSQIPGDDNKYSSFSGKLAGGFEVDFSYVSFGGLVNYYYFASAGASSQLKSVQAIAPLIFVSFHDSVDGEKQMSKSSSK